MVDIELTVDMETDQVSKVVFLNVKLLRSLNELGLQIGARH